MKRLIEFREAVGALKSPSSVFEKVKRINIDYMQENLICLFLNSKNQIIDSEVVFKGGLNSCVIDPRTLFRKAMAHNANCIIIAHNHPSGNLEPSFEDISSFKRLKEGGDLVGISVLDSIIFNQNEYYCMELGC